MRAKDLAVVRTCVWHAFCASAKAKIQRVREKWAIANINIAFHGIRY